MPPCFTIFIELLMSTSWLILELRFNVIASLSEVYAIDVYRESLLVMLFDIDRPFLMSLDGLGFSVGYYPIMILFSCIGYI